MTDDNDNDPLNEAMKAVGNYEEDVNIDQHLNRALRHINTSAQEIQKALDKQAVLRASAN